MNPPHNLESLVHLHRNLISSIPAMKMTWLRRPVSHVRLILPCRPTSGPTVHRYAELTLTCQYCANGCLPFKAPPDALLTQPQPQEVQVRQ